MWSLRKRLVPTVVVDSCCADVLCEIAVRSGRAKLPWLLRFIHEHAQIWRGISQVCVHCVSVEVVNLAGVLLLGSIPFRPLQLQCMND